MVGVRGLDVAQESGEVVQENLKGDQEEEVVQENLKGSQVEDGVVVNF